MAKREKDRDERHRANMARHALICGPKGVMAGVALHPNGASSCGQAGELAGKIIPPNEAPYLPLRGCREDQCLCHWRTVTWRRAREDDFYQLA